MEFFERVQHKETMHVNNGSVDAQLVHFELLAQVTDEKGGLLTLAKLLFAAQSVLAARRVFYRFGSEYPPDV